MKRSKMPKQPVRQKKLPPSGIRKPTLEVYYDPAKQCYWIEDSRGDWITLNEASLKRHLKSCGFSAQVPKGEQLSPVDQCLNAIQRESNVVYAGPLAGHKKGFIKNMCGQRILVTNSPTLITPVEGDWPILRKFQENLFGPDQLPYVWGWEKIAFESLCAQHLRPGQVLVLAGETDSGKSLYQNLETEIVGGRVAKPYCFMSGGTNFNADLFGAEHLMIEDEFASTDIRSRRHFGARIKGFTVNTTQFCHAKNRQAISLKPFWRLSVSLNDEPENLMILPPLDDSLKDKVMLLKVFKAQMPMPTETPQQRDEFWQTLLKELPAYLWFLTHWEIPEALRCKRFGVKNFHHPDLLEALDEIAHEDNFLALIDEVFGEGTEFKDIPGVVGVKDGQGSRFDGSAERLQGLLCFHTLYGHKAKSLLYWPNAAATFLGRLAKKHPDRVTYTRTANQRIWHITPPPAEAVANGQVRESNADRTNQIIAASQGKGRFDAPTG
jgi:hypothetical protein